MKFIKLTTIKGNTLIVNTALVESARRSKAVYFGDYTILMADQRYHVRETPEQIAAMLEEEKQ